MSKLQNKTAAITGGSTGIGLATAKRFVAEGATVFLFGRTREALDSAVAEIGHGAVGVQGDVTNAQDLDRLFETVRRERGQLDILFANAGVGANAHLSEVSAAHFDRIFDTNVKGTVFTVQKALPLMRSGASIILTGSTTGSMATPSFSVYSAAKAAIRNFARNWALDLTGTGIRVNVLSPGATETPGLQELLEDSGQATAARQALVSATPLGRLADPSEIASVATFLASDDSSFMTGSEVFADGGLAQV
ncbi:MAG: SDR family oxidoreductase [Planctomycetes bacterium]|nr:SDR family oxidoreductase [Planctomycetota bacterium]